MTIQKSVTIKDGDLQADVLDELAFTSEVNHAHVGVSANDGVITLSGEVDSLPERLAAERAALRVSGVKAVADEIIVRLPGTVGTSDIDIAQAAVANLDSAVDVPPDSVQAKVRNQVLTLTGKVRWDYQRRAAERCVRYLRGLVAVDNQITLDQPISVKGVKEAIESAFQRNAQIDASNITVEVKDHHLVLHGTVRSWAEHRQAEHAAWNVPGVTSLSNQLHVNP
ncbi:BON domain-containing protein [Catelliglobosispora koreensis]|uniref:BON domain-containing protein n=1 Tax=Catelliglobosispora koreensis TaxID=129052 RepID=UPI00037A78A5|nr:BON domain-containing protein [Catelliglobosispora koreensis]